MKDNIYTVSQVNNYIKLLLEDDVLLNGIYIEGEISNLKRHTSGHIYFTIKDEDCSINAVMYRQDTLSFKDEFENGLKVICFGHISAYPKTGQYQLYVKNIKISGIGDVFLDFEKLKEKLKNEGLFDKVYKMDIPLLPKSIGVITSQTGAAIRDILNVAKRRNPNIKIILIPALVQGKDAPNSIINAINMANKFKNLDIIILARGGGSKEDLWAFNNEDLARAIFYSSIPIVTGIGHEIDFTIADFVADFSTIKDEECSINAVMYRQDALSFKDEFENGIKVICFGYISSYTKTGQYQLYVKNVKVSGLGDVF